MRKSFLTLFVFVLCTRPILTSDLPLRFTSQHRGLNPSNSSVRGEEAIAVERDERIKDMIKNYDKLSDATRKAQRGKGATGGSNVDQGFRRSKNSASSLLVSWISTFLLLHVSLALTFLFS